MAHSPVEVSRTIVEEMAKKTPIRVLRAPWRLYRVTRVRASPPKSEFAHQSVGIANPKELAIFLKVAQMVNPKVYK
jgi:hypothetical protein